MSTETPELPKSIYQLRRQAVARAITAWEDGPEEAGPFGDAAALEDHLLDEGLLILPRAAVHGKWMVLVDGQAAPFPGQDRLSGPVDAEQAAEMFLIEAAKADDPRSVTVRPASNAEMVSSVLGDPMVLPEPVEVTADGYAISYPDTDPDPDVRVVLFTTDDGRPVRVRMDIGLLRMLSQSASDEVSEWDATNGGEA